MKLATFKPADSAAPADSSRAGLVIDDEIIPLTNTSGGPVTVRRILEAGTEGDELLERAARAPGKRLSLREVRLEAPVPNPRKFLGLGANYRAHVAELKARMPGFEPPRHQMWFNKQVTCIIGPYGPMQKPAASEQFDYEGELAVVIGKRCRHVKAAEAHRVIAGYTVCNDATVRDWLLRSPTATLGKSFDTHGPMGPWLTTRLCVEQAEDLEIRTWVNAELRQHGRTSDFIHGIRQMIAELSAVFTLEPGDILATGTPPGVGAGMTPPRFLQVGDQVRVEIEGLGAIDNPVIAEPPGHSAGSGDINP